MVVDFLKYLYHSHNLHGVHSPFVYTLNEKVLNNCSEPPGMPAIREYRHFLSRCQETIQVDDPGSGSRKHTGNIRTVGEIYKTASGNHRMGIMLYHLLSYFRCKTVIELGTNLGVSTAYACQHVLPGLKIFSIEGSRAIYEFTQSHFSKYFPATKPDFLFGNFDTVLPGLLASTRTVDLAFIDGNHTYEATVRYFHELLPFVHNESILIFDDIYWSEGMKNAWKEITRHEKVTCSVDLFRWGIIFFRKEMKKEDFTIRFTGFLKAHIMQ